MYSSGGFILLDIIIVVIFIILLNLDKRLLLFVPLLSCNRLTLIRPWITALKLYFLLYTLLLLGTLWSSLSRWPNLWPPQPPFPKIKPFGVLERRRWTGGTGMYYNIIIHKWCLSGRAVIEGYTSPPPIIIILSLLAFSPFGRTSRTQTPFFR